MFFFFFFSSRRRHTRFDCDWSSDVCSSDLLEGGMRAWSLAWNTAEVSCPGSTARIVQLRRTGKGCLSYLIGSNGAAVVIDASLDPQVYHRLADEHGLRIRTLLQTHADADHLVPARALADDTGARLYFPATDRVSFEYAPLNDEIGRASCRERV